MDTPGAKYSNTRLIQQAKLLGIDRIGVARACPVPRHITNRYNNWIEHGMHASMDYLDRYHDVRCDPRELLPGTRSVISCAIGYYHSERQPAGIPSIASYAHGDDYHEVVKRLLEPLASWIKENYGGDTRTCVDTAPIHERYWAVEAGVGFRARSGLIIVPGLGTYSFLAELLTTAEFEPTLPLGHRSCDGCDRCIKACPGNAIGPDGEINANRCLSYLTIEHRGDLPEGLSTHGRLYGCDTCQSVCPHNKGLDETIHPEFKLRQTYRELTPARIEAMTPEEYAATFRHSAIKRAKLPALKRNLSASQK